MTDIVSEILTALNNREHVALATIIAGSGSTPLPPGSMLLVRQAAKPVLGTVGGGAVEGGVITLAKQILEGSEDFVISQFELSEAGTESGMICGGTVDVLIERIGPAEHSFFARLTDVHNQGGSCVLLRGLAKTRKVIGRMIVEGTPPDSGDSSRLKELCEEYGISTDALLPLMQRAHRHETVERVPGSNGEIIVQPMVGAQPLIIFGGGHIGRVLSKFAALSGFSVTVVDEREEYARPARFPEADHTIAERWSASSGALKITPATSVVIVTSGHKSDAEVLRQLAKTNARYVGMIGSRKKVSATFSQLMNDGVPVEWLRLVHAPIGLDIGAVTAEEIAISIVAELIRVRRGYEKVSAPLSAQMADWFDRPQASSPRG